MADEKEIRCSFCNKPKRELGYVIQGANSRICDSCITKAGKAVEAQKAKDASGIKNTDIPTPKEIHAFLNEYVIGQDLAKRSLAVATFDHYL